MDVLADLDICVEDTRVFLNVTIRKGEKSERSVLGFGKTLELDYLATLLEKYGAALKKAAELM